MPDEVMPIEHIEPRSVHIIMNRNIIIRSMPYRL